MSNRGANASFSYRCWAKSHVGLVRASNEDCFALSAAPLERGAWAGSLATQAWALLADGMGGHAAGEVASRIAVEILGSLIGEIVSTSDVSEALESANRALFDAMQRDPGLQGMGTTIAGVLLHDEHVLLFNVGDSRIYFQSGTSLHQLSEDHGFGHLLTQCLGGFDRPERLVPAISQVRMEAGARLLLCSDGLTDMLSDSEIADLLAAESEDPAAALVDAALAAGGRDNVTVILLEATLRPVACR